MELEDHDEWTIGNLKKKETEKFKREDFNNFKRDYLWDKAFDFLLILKYLKTFFFLILFLGFGFEKNITEI